MSASDERATAGDGTRRATALSLVAAAAYAVGVGARWAYILVGHHPRNHVFSDGMPILELAEVLVDPNGRQQFLHTVWPPGMSAFLAASLAYDPSLGSAAAWQWALSCIAPLAIGHAARLAYGPRVGWAALLLSALHFGFIHYSGFFLAEGMFDVSVAIAVWTTVAALVVGRSAKDGRAPSEAAPASTRLRAVAGAASGLAWGIAFSFRSNALPVAAFAAFCLAVTWLRRKRRGELVSLGAGAIAMLAIMAALAHRCSVLVGHFCPGANNFAMNVALGHAPEVAGLHFRPITDENSSGMNYWLPPALAHHGYQGIAEVSGSIYDSGRVLLWVKDQFLKDPLDFALDSAGNVLDLFGSEYWPDDYGPLKARAATVAQQLVLVFVLIPGMAMWGLLVRRWVRRRDLDDVDRLFVVAILAVFLLAAASLGEARYRVPFDAIFVILASRALVGRDPQHQSLGMSLGPALRVVAVALAVVAAVLLGVADPQIRLAARLSNALPKRRISRAVTLSLPLAALGALPEEGRSWDAPENRRLECTPKCQEIRLSLGELRHSAAIEVSADHNDRYEVVFYREGREVGRVAWGVFEGQDGMRTVRRDVPDSAKAAGYDTLALHPLYGDGMYSVGYVNLL